jgi:hypothetical protein
MPAPEADSNARLAYRRPQPAEMAPDLLVAPVLPADDRVWVPQAPNVWFRPLCCPRRRATALRGDAAQSGHRGASTKRTYCRSRYSNQSKSAACAVPDMSWQAMPTKAPVKLGAPGAVASSDRMLASNSSGRNFQ